MPEIATATPPMTMSAIASPKQQFLDVYRKETATTLRVIKAFPEGKDGFKPHDDCRTALQLAWNFVIEQRLSLAAVNGTLTMPPHFPPAPDSFDEVLTAYERDVRELDAVVSAAPDTRLNEPVTFFTGPKQLGQMAVMEMLWFTLMDMVHHRGQFSVYLRMCGGKVPSIYGPSKDEPWM